MFDNIINLSIQLLIDFCMQFSLFDVLANESDQIWSYFADECHEHHGMSVCVCVYARM